MMQAIYLESYSYFICCYFFVFPHRIHTSFFYFNKDISNFLESFSKHLVDRHTCRGKSQGFNSRLEDLSRLSSRMAKAFACNGTLNVNATRCVWLYIVSGITRLPPFPPSVKYSAIVVSSVHRRRNLDVVVIVVVIKTDDT